jgi:hypothetical protein
MSTIPNNNKLLTVTLLKKGIYGSAYYWECPGLPRLCVVVAHDATGPHQVFIPGGKSIAVAVADGLYPLARHPLDVQRLEAYAAGVQNSHTRRVATHRRAAALHRTKACVTCGRVPPPRKNQTR